MAPAEAARGRGGRQWGPCRRATGPRHPGATTITTITTITVSITTTIIIIIIIICIYIYIYICIHILLYYNYSYHNTVSDGSCRSCSGPWGALTYASSYVYICRGMLVQGGTLIYIYIYI